MVTRRTKAEQTTRATPPPGMSGVMLEMYLLYTYGPRLDMEQCGLVLRVARSTVFNQLSAGTFPVKTYLDGAFRYADYRDVAAHLEQCRAGAEAAAARMDD